MQGFKANPNTKQTVLIIFHTIGNTTASQPVGTPDLATAQMEDYVRILRSVGSEEIVKKFSEILPLLKEMSFEDYDNNSLKAKSMWYFQFLKACLFNKNTCNE